MTNFKNCADVLKKIRLQHYSQLDTSTLAELDEVITELESAGDKKLSKTDHFALCAKGLKYIDIIVRLVSNISDWMQ